MLSRPAALDGFFRRPMQKLKIQFFWHCIIAIAGCNYRFSKNIRRKR